MQKILKEIILEAGKSRKVGETAKTYAKYEKIKKQIAILNLTPSEYEEFIKELVVALGI